MKFSAQFSVVLVTAPDMRTARELAKAALTARLAACVNVVRGVQSFYWWRGKMASATEALLVLKTRQKNLAALEKLLHTAHPYDTPEFLVLPVNGGSKKYLAWLGDNCR